MSISPGPHPRLDSRLSEKKQSESDVGRKEEGGRRRRKEEEERRTRRKS
jgi:hypothetical protein